MRVSKRTAASGQGKEETKETNLDVINVRKVGVQKIHERSFVDGQFRAGEGLDKVAKVVAGVKRDPFDVVIEDEA